MLHIYRVENENGKGCYFEGAISINRLGKHNCLARTPHPIHDVGIKREPVKKEICGFKSLQQARKWFTKTEFKRMAKNGYELKRCDVKKITAESISQVFAVR